MTLITHQTGPEGKKVQRLLIEETLPIARELYLGIVLDRGNGRNVFMASAAGGMEIEEVAAKDPDAIIKEHIIPGMGLQALPGAQDRLQTGTRAEVHRRRGEVHDRPGRASAKTPTPRCSRSILSSPRPTAGCSRSMPR